MIQVSCWITTSFGARGRISDYKLLDRSDRGELEDAVKKSVRGAITCGTNLSEITQLKKLQSYGNPGYGNFDFRIFAKSTIETTLSLKRNKGVTADRCNPFVIMAER